MSPKNFSPDSTSTPIALFLSIRIFITLELNFISILDYIPKIQKLYNKYGELSGFIYKDKEYSLYYSDNKLLGNKVPYKCSISSFKKIINCKISYDYNNKIIYINLFNT